MKGKELIKAALRNMNENDDENTYDIYKDEILLYINEGYMQVVVTKLKPVKTVSCQSKNGAILIDEIGEDFYEISRIVNKSGIEMRYSLNNEKVFIKDGDYEVEYVYIPSNIDETNEPIISRAFHSILSDYATYRMFLKGSKARQARGDAFFSNYLNGISKLVEAKRLHIKNKFGSDLDG